LQYPHFVAHILAELIDLGDSLLFMKLLLSVLGILLWMTLFSASVLHAEDLTLIDYVSSIPVEQFQLGQCRYVLHKDF